MLYLILLLIFSLSSLQELDNSEPEAEDDPLIELSPVAPVVLFGKNAPPLSKVLMQSYQAKPSSKASAKRKEAPVADAPQAKKAIVKRKRPVISPISSDSETSADKQVRTSCLFLLYIA